MRLIPSWMRHRGKITPSSIATSLAINAISEGVSVRGAKGAKADVNTNKPKAGDVPVTKSHKDMTPVQQLAFPGPTSKPLALPAPKSTPNTDFYVAPDGATFTAADYSSTYGHREFKPGELDIHYDKHKDEVVNVLGGLIIQRTNIYRMLTM